MEMNYQCKSSMSPENAEDIVSVTLKRDAMIQAYREQGIILAEPFENVTCETLSKDHATQIQNKIEKDYTFSKSMYTLGVSSNNLPLVCKPYEIAYKVINSLPIFSKDGFIYYYNGTHYQVADQRTMLGIIYSICNEEFKAIGDRQPFASAYKILCELSEIQVTEDMLNKQFLSFQNGVLNQATGELYYHNPCFRTTYVINCGLISDYASCYCPNFDNYLYSATDGDWTLVRRIWEMIGYCISTDTNAKALFCLQGVANSGKSLLTHFLTNLYPGRVSAMDVSDLKTNFALGNYRNMSLCISPDMSADPLDAKTVGHLKKLSGNDTVNSDVKYSQRTQFRFEGKIAMVTNNPILTELPDPAFYKRIVTIPFYYAPEHPDRELLQKFWEERSAIVSKSLHMYFALRNNQYIFSGDYPLNDPALFSGAYTNSADKKRDLIGRFLMDNFIPDPDSKTSLVAMHQYFLQTVGDISETKFCSMVKEIAPLIFRNCRHDKKRIDTPHAISCILGIRFINQTVQCGG